MRNLSITLGLVLASAGWFPACSQTPPAAGAQPQVEALAVVDGTPITAKDLDLERKLLRVEQERYSVTSDALEEAIAARLLEKEATNRGITTDQLIETEINAKISEPSDAEIEAFYERQKARIRQPLEDIRSQIGEALKAMKRGQLRQELVAGLREKSKVVVHLDPPRIPIDLEGAPQRGPSDAPVTIVEFSDFQCPFCKGIQPTINQLRQKYPKEISWRFKDLPLNSIHSSAQYAAEAARCAGDQGKFWEYREALFKSEQLTRDMHKGIGESLGLDNQAFLGCLSSEKYRKAVEADSEEAESLGLTGTPTFVINGIVLAGAQPLEEFTKVIEAELRRKGAASVAQ